MGIGWPVLIGLLAAVFAQWLWRAPPGMALSARLRLAASRRWGAFHRLVSGDLWEAGEEELYRDEVAAVSVAEGGQHIPIHRHSLCILTNRRLILCEPGGHMIQLPLESIRAARVYRDFDPQRGSDYWVAIDRQGSYAHAHLGDVGVRCIGGQQSRVLAEHIQEAIEHARAG